MDPNTLSLIKSSLQIIPNYDGNPNQLSRFITTCEIILSQYYDATQPDSFTNCIILHNILNKLQGRAEEVVNINGVSSWDHIKNVLQKNFCDQRDENCLNRDLVNMKQENESVQDFYNRCMHILNTIINYVELHEIEDSVKSCKRDFFQAQTLKTFLAGLKEPLGTTIRAMRPLDMATALNYIKEEENIQYIKKKNNMHVFAKPNDNNKPLFFNNLRQPLSNKPFQPQKPYFMNPNNRPHLPPINRSNNFRQPYPGSYKPNNNYNQHVNRPQGPFRPPQQGFSNFQYKQISQPKPEPMSGISYSSANIPLKPLINNYHNTQCPNGCVQFQETYLQQCDPYGAHAEYSGDAFQTDNETIACTSKETYTEQLNESQLYCESNETEPLNSCDMSRQENQNFCLGPITEVND